MDAFDHAQIPDLSPEFAESAHWLANYFLNTTIGIRLTGHVEQVALGFLRRADQAFSSFHEARDITLGYVSAFEKSRPKIRQYYRAVARWEVFILQTQMAFELYNFLSNERVFEKSDGSPEQRLHTMTNIVKHYASHVTSPNNSGVEVLPLWIESDGLHCASSFLSFTEAANVLRDVATLADLLQDPAQFVRTIN